MKKQLKTKLRLNSQTLRTMRACSPSALQGVQGGRVMLEEYPDDSMNCTNLCTLNCRGCG